MLFHDVHVVEETGCAAAAGNYKRPGCVGQQVFEALVFEGAKGVFARSGEYIAYGASRGSFDKSVEIGKGHSVMTGE
jgi:hypothetical protein